MSQVTDDTTFACLPDSIRGKGYEVTAKLGEGGFARVYLARKANWRVRYAVKVLREELASDPDGRRAFLAEAYKLHEIAHDRIIAARDVHPTEGEIPWFAMDYAEGGTLDTWVRRTGTHLELPQIVGLGVEICHCLLALHDYDIVHFDLKPHNVLIQHLADSVDRRRGGRFRLPPDQRLLLGDLGLARTSAELHEGGGGTLRYQAPETFRDQGSERSDLFALGIMLYEFAHPGTGDTPVRPFEGRIPSSRPSEKRSLFETERWGEYLPVQAVRPELPSAFDDVLRGLLAPDPDDRYPSAYAVEQALDQLLRQGPRRGPADEVVRQVDDVLTDVADGMRQVEVGPEAYDLLNSAGERLRRRRPRIVVMPAGSVDSSPFTLFLAGESPHVTVPAPYGSVITHFRYGRPERAMTEGRLGEEQTVDLHRDVRHDLRATLPTDSIRRLTLMLDHDSLRDVELVDAPGGALRRDEIANTVARSDLVVVLAADLEGARRTLSDLREASRSSLAGPLGFVAVDTEARGFDEPGISTRELEELGYEPALGMANAGLTLRVLFEQMLDNSRGGLIAASGALALCDMACARSKQWTVAKRFIDRRDLVERDFPELRDIRYLREDARGDFTLPPAYACELRRTLAQPTPAGKLDLASDEADVATVRAVAEERLFDWMTALGDGSVPAESAVAARTVVAALRRLQDAENV